MTNDGKPKSPTAGQPPTKEEDALVDELIDESFPASDPPPASGGTAGGPKRRRSTDPDTGRES